MQINTETTNRFMRWQALVHSRAVDQHYDHIKPLKHEQCRAQVHCRDANQHHNHIKQREVWGSTCVPGRRPDHPCGAGLPSWWLRCSLGPQPAPPQLFQPRFSMQPARHRTGPATHMLFNAASSALYQTCNTRAFQCSHLGIIQTRSTRANKCASSLCQSVRQEFASLYSPPQLA